MPYIGTATIKYGPFETKSKAREILLKTKAVKNAKASAIVGRAGNYSFSVKVMFKVNTANDRSIAAKQIKSNAPSARVTFRKI